VNATSHRWKTVLEGKRERARTVVTVMGASVIQKFSANWKLGGVDPRVGAYAGLATGSDVGDV